MLQVENTVTAKFLPTLLLIGILTWILPGQILVRSRFKGAPSIMLWAWERPEDIRNFPDVDKVGVAFLAATINLSAIHTGVNRRKQPLLCSPHQYLMPVVRIETSRKNPPFFSVDLVDEVVAQILQIAANPNWHGVQIDFDATQGQRESYKTLLTRLRKSMPPEMPLSMTAIASWCAGDLWLADLPVDEVVPMYFDMGVSESMKWQYFQYISDNTRNDWTANCKCHKALGLSTSEAIPLRATQYKNKRVYFFSSRPWQMLSNRQRNDITKILKYTEAS
ncbi:MAG: DUF3142 domain-containing protein [Candidatus Obscuribacterales bacterium]|nr:DUF3142 domain-containing protein [Candidatus Obscuribacterales bacterium]